MATQTLTLNWGTWLKSTDNTIPHGSDLYMEVGEHSGWYNARPLMKFNYTGTPGEVLSASLNIYVTNRGGDPQVQVWRITRESTINATWQSSGITAWATAGAENMNNDRYQIALTGEFRINATGWISIPITNLTQLQTMLEGTKTLIIRPVDIRTPATIDKNTNPPYLGLTYKSSLAGGVQII